MIRFAVENARLSDSIAVASTIAMIAYALAQALLLLYATHRWVLLWRWWRGSRGPVACEAAPRPPSAAGGFERRIPFVTVQLPMFNERAVVERSIAAAAALDWPRDRFEIQVLDDSDDETRARAAAAVAVHRARGIDILHVTRPRRDGFKAGALAAGLARARGEFVAVFDADFVPPPEFLKRTMRAFDDPRVGMVQACWAHLNRHRSGLTAAQAVLLDAHFHVEHRTRAASGLFFNFNGTAGVWRRACIEEAGGWSHDTLTEDLDLSYRAQLLGWRFAFVEDLEVPAELPAHLEALQAQQHRWAKGSIQTARKLLPAVWRSALPRRVKIEAFFHLTSNVAYPLLLALGLLLVPVLLAPAATAAWVVVALQILVLVLGVVPVAAFLAVGRRLSGGSAGRIALEVPAALLLGVGLSWTNTRAVFEGMRGAAGEWRRTPKTGDAERRPAPRRAYDATGAHGWIELTWAAYFAGVAAWTWAAGFERTVPFVAWLALGFAFVGARASRPLLRGA